MLIYVNITDKHIKSIVRNLTKYILNFFDDFDKNYHKININ